MASLVYSDRKGVLERLRNRRCSLQSTTESSSSSTTSGSSSSSSSSLSLPVFPTFLKSSMFTKSSATTNTTKTTTTTTATTTTTTTTTTTASATSSFRIKRVEIANDNQCLFHCINIGYFNGIASVSLLKDVCEKAIREDKFYGPFLECSSQEYCRKLIHPDFWGGHIEQMIFSKEYGLEFILILGMAASPIAAHHQTGECTWNIVAFSLGDTHTTT